MSDMSDRSYEQVPAAHSDDSTAQVAADQARGVAQDAKASGAQVAQTAKDETAQVVAGAKQQAKDLFEQVRGELTDQTSTQQHRAAGGLHGLADELRQMSEGREQSGVASDLAGQASDRAHSVADWLDSREPGDLVTELKNFARRRPGAFLGAAALVGFLGGRLTRALTADPGDDAATQQPSAPGSDWTAMPPAEGPVYGTQSTGMPASGFTEASFDEGRRQAPPDVPVVAGTSQGRPVLEPADPSYGDDVR